jgi:hypothetical protein
MMRDSGTDRDCVPGRLFRHGQFLRAAACLPALRPLDPFVESP